MESLKLLPTAVYTTTAPARSTRRKANGAATAALLIQVASEILDSSPTLRKRLGINLTDLAAADKIRKDLLRKALPIQ